VDWISLSQERDKWRSPVNAHKVWGISWRGEELLASRLGYLFAELVNTQVTGRKCHICNI
jgi:hypothetical protein